MASLDIFKDDAFSLQSLTKAINEQPYVPGRIGALGLFSEEGVNTTSVSVEKLGESLSLVAAGERGAPAKAVGGDKRTLVNFNTIHLPQRAKILADEVQGVR
ncbi:MAG TPA: major capsid protein, partial [Spirochaetota bacterium]|nr:major capsid protein [Spirochaetota bacterium]